MPGRLLRILALGLGGVLAAAGMGLLLAHREIDALDPPLPSLVALRAFAAAPDLPTQLAVVDTASQEMPRALVLDPSRDPRPGARYVMSHPAVVLIWADGRRLLVDAGMDRAGALAFGRPIEWLGGQPIEPHASLAERIGGTLARAGPLGIVFTHLHTDHVGGVAALCAALPPSMRVSLFQREAQIRLANYTTRPGRAQLAAARCLAPVALEEAPVAAVPGFPGVFVIHAAGHTPGSQVVGAWLRETPGAPPRGWLFPGDVANAVDGIREEVPKPWAYSTFVVPESAARLARLRGFLRDAEAAGMTLVPAHDALHLRSLGLPSR